MTIGHEKWHGTILVVSFGRHQQSCLLYRLQVATKLAPLAPELLQLQDLGMVPPFEPPVAVGPDLLVHHEDLVVRCE